MLQILSPGDAVLLYHKTLVNNQICKLKVLCKSRNVKRSQPLHPRILKLLYCPNFERLNLLNAKPNLRLLVII